MVIEDTRREFLRKFGGIGGVTGFSSSGGDIDTRKIGDQLPKYGKQYAHSISTVSSVSFGQYHATVDGMEYGPVTLHFADGSAKTFSEGYQGSNTFSYVGYRGTGDVIPIHEGGIDFGNIPTSAPVDETYDSFHGPIVRVTVVEEQTKQEFKRAESPKCVYGVEFDCSQVGFDYRSETHDIDLVLVYGDGSYKRFEEYYINDQLFGEEDISDQRLDRIYLRQGFDNGWYEFSNPNTDCSPNGASVATFECSEVTVESGLISAEAFNFDGRIHLMFTDGSSQQVEAEDTYPMTFSGQGKHAGKTIQAFRIHVSANDGVVWHLMNPQAVDCDEATQRFQILSTDEKLELSYRFRVDGDVSKAEFNDNRADPKETIRRNDDGTVTVTGTTGDLEGDVFAVSGDILEFEMTGGESSFRLLLDDTDVTDELTDGQDSGGDSEASLLEIVSTEEGEISYRVVVRGTAEKTRVSEKIASQDNDKISQQEDGRVVIDGYTGNPGYGDAFEITGEIVSFERTGGDADVRLELDGEDVTEQFIDESSGDSSVFEVISTEEGEISYRVLIDGTVEKTRVSEKIASQDNDEIRERDDSLMVIEGYTGNPGYGDAFEITGEIVSFERTGGDADVRLELDGEDVTDQYLDEE